MSRAFAIDYLDHALDLIDILNFCLTEDMPNKYINGSEKLFYLVNSIEELIKKSKEEYEKD